MTKDSVKRYQILDNGPIYVLESDYTSLLKLVEELEKSIKQEKGAR